MQNDLIAAISTPLGRGAVAIVRISGEGALELALKIFHAKNLDGNSVIPRYMHYGKISLKEGDEHCLMVFFKAPFSYTGEDCVEFQVHGGVLLAQKVLEKVIESGARLAEAGEFSKRAFLNGKISLDEAESIIDEIDAESESELRCSLNVGNGKLKEKVQKMQDEVENMVAEIEVNLDYPDEVDENKLRLATRSRLEKIDSDLNEILNDSENAKFVKNGVNVALVGQTNVGKSSVMNALLGSDRAIVTDIQGTTRDVVCDSFMFSGIKINLFDTAGIRETSDLVENLGIERSKISLQESDLVLFIVDGSEKESESEKEIENLIKGKKHLFVVNKSDKPRVRKRKSPEIEISAKTGQGVQELKKEILKMVELEEISPNSLLITNERQHQTLTDCKKILCEILNSPHSSLDIFASLLKNLWLALGKVTGKTENEDIINLIFSKFCLGK